MKELKALYAHWKYLHLDRFLFNLNPVNLWQHNGNPYVLPNCPAAHRDLLSSYVDLYSSFVYIFSRQIGNILAGLVPFGLLLWSLPLWP